MITVSVDSKSVLARLDAMPDRVRAELRKKVTDLALKLEAKVKRKVSGEVLNVRSGDLRRSIFNDVSEADASVIGRVYSSGDVKYAAIHEYGGRTPPHVIEAKGNALAFLMGGKMVFAKRVNHPGSRIPERSYVRSSLEEMAGQIEQGLRDAVIEGLK